VAESPPSTAGVLLAPRHWPTWLALGLLRLLIRLPYRTQMRLGRALGRPLMHLLARRRHIVEVNLDLCLPDLPTEQRERIIRAQFEGMGMALFESGLAWWGRPERLARLGTLHGIEHLHNAAALGRGVILLSCHMLSLEIGGRLLAPQQPFQVMYKEQRKNPLFEAVMSTARRTHYIRAVQRHDVRGMLRGLREGLVCWYAPDQDFGEKNAVYAPFFGVPTATVTATSRFARMTGARVVPYYPVRRADDSGYDLYILPAWEHFPSDDEVADATRVNQFIEAAVREHPEQYLWLHRRFRSRPDGGPDRYA